MDWSLKSKEVTPPLTPKRSERAGRLTRMALLTAIALTIFMVEAQLPNPIPIPGIKLGLANIVTVYAMFVLGAGETLMILLARVFLGSVFSGQMMTLFYSLAGGLLCWLAMIVLRRLLTRRQIWVCSIIGGGCHNVGQLIAAILIARTPALVVYLPYLLPAGMAAGLFTGLCAQFLVARLDKLHGG